jgi:hypothetical protein
MHRTINGYLHDNWETIRTDLAFNGIHREIFDAGARVGVGYFNSTMGRPGAPVAVYHATSLVRIAIRAVPGSDPPQLYIDRAFPTGGVG